MLVVAVDASACDDASKVESFAQISAGLVEQVSYPFPASLWVNVYVSSIQAIPFWVVVVEIATIRNACVGVLSVRIDAKVHDQAGYCSENRVVLDGYELALGKEPEVV